MNNAIRLGRAMEKYRLAWLEDLIPWQYTDEWKEITRSIETPTLTGEDIYLKEEFIKLVIIMPLILSILTWLLRGLLETKKIGIMRRRKGWHGDAFCRIARVFHGQCPLCAATENFVALEHHSLDLPYWSDLQRRRMASPFSRKDSPMCLTRRDWDLN